MGGSRRAARAGLQVEEAPLRLVRAFRQFGGALPHPGVGVSFGHVQLRILARLPAPRLACGVRSGTRARAQFPRFETTSLERSRIPGMGWNDLAAGVKTRSARRAREGSSACPATRRARHRSGDRARNSRSCRAHVQRWIDPRNAYESRIRASREEASTPRANNLPHRGFIMRSKLLLSWPRLPVSRRSRTPEPTARARSSSSPNTTATRASSP